MSTECIDAPLYRAAVETNAQGRLHKLADYALGREATDLSQPMPVQPETDLDAKRTDSPKEATAAGIPRTLAPCFQEYDLERLDPNEHGDLLIERVLAYGNRRELRWLFHIYGQERVSEWVKRMGARRLPWRRYNLWCVLLQLPPARRVRPEGQQIWPH